MRPVDDRFKLLCRQTNPVAVVGVVGHPRSNENLGSLIERIAISLEKIAKVLDPPPSDKVGTRYVADKLGCSTIWITELIRKGEIPPSCIVDGTGNGKVWKFHRSRIDAWIAGR